MTATDIIELYLRYGCSEIGSPTIIDYIHEVEHRASMESRELANKHQKLADDVAKLKALQKGTIKIKIYLYHIILFLFILFIETWEMTDNIN